MRSFTGREEELATLNRALQMVVKPRTDRPGQCLLVRGRRRVGKSRLVEEFIERSEAPYLYFTAARGTVTEQLRQFREDALDSTLPGRDVLVQGRPYDWDGAFRLLAAALPDEQASVVVFDEVPYLMDDGQTFESLLQRAWDRHLVRKPVLLILVGSDLSMMEALNTYQRPFHQRGREMVVGAMNPADVGEMLNLDPVEALDATLVTGGLPLICADWPDGVDLWTFLESSLANPISALLVSAERSLAAEFPERAQADIVLRAIGSGERTFTNIARAAGEIGSTPLHRSLDTLLEKRLIAGEQPLSTRPSKDRHYRIVDPYLRFWLRFLRPAMPEIERGRGDLALERIRTAWTSWRGSAIEPLIREALARTIPDDTLPSAVIGSYWTRTHDIEIDIVGADRAPIAKEIRFVGSIKWLEKAPFDEHDLADLMRHRAALTDGMVPAIAVSRHGARSLPSGLDRCYGPEDVLAAWRD